MRCLLCDPLQTPNRPASRRRPRAHPHLGKAGRPILVATIARPTYVSPAPVTVPTRPCRDPGFGTQIRAKTAKITAPWSGRRPVEPRLWAISSRIVCSRAGKPSGTRGREPLHIEPRDYFALEADHTQNWPLRWKQRSARDRSGMRTKQLPVRCSGPPLRASAAARRAAPVHLGQDRPATSSGRLMLNRLANARSMSGS
jgi:hypothetical protein